MTTKEISFGEWVRRQRRGQDLSRKVLASQVGCAEITLRRIEAGSLKPSRELAGILLAKLGVPDGELEAWIHFARGLSGFPTKTPDDKESIATKPQSNLPVFLTKFIGREKELAEIIQLVNRHRLVTLAGLGGVGKTRLASIAGEQLQNSFSYGVHMVELASLNDPALIAQAVATQLNIEIQSNTIDVELLTNFLSKKNMLIILDNCEHLLLACAKLVDTLLKNCPNLNILATSREPIQIAGEAVFQVPPLGIPDNELSLKKYREFEAIRLFEERAQLVLSDFSLTTENASSVVQICRVLDGVPLAIELAAARVDIFSVAQIAARIQESFNLLTGGSRTALPRQQTIRGSIDWSWKLLSDEERSLLSRLSIFSGGWTLEAAEMVCSGNRIEVQQVAELMSQLKAKSLIVMNRQAGKHRRYSLHELIRQYASEKLAKEDEEFSRSQHLKHFLMFSEQAESALLVRNQSEWFTRLSEEQNNIRSALDWASKTDLETGLYIIGRLGGSLNFREGTYWTSRFLEQEESHQYPHARAKALLVQSYCLLFNNQLEASHHACEESLELFRACNDREGEFWGLMMVGSGYGVTQAMETGFKFQEQALALARELGDPMKQAIVLNELGWWDDRDRKRSNAYCEEAITLFRQMGNWRRLIDTLGKYAHTLMIFGEAHEMEKVDLLLEEADSLMQEIDFKDSYELEFVLVAKSQKALLDGEFDQARANLLKWLKLAEDSGNRIGYLWTRARLGVVAIAEGSLEEAAQILCETVRAFHMDESYPGLIFTIEKIAHLYSLTGRVDQVPGLLGWADKMREQMGHIRPKTDQLDVDRDIEICTSQLGKGTVSKGINQGCNMTTDEAVALALEYC